MPVARPIPFLLDTDIGDNVDDALALALACQSAELELVGVTTVYRYPHIRLGFAQAVLSVFGRRDVPVAAGLSRPLARTAGWPKLGDPASTPHLRAGWGAVRFLIDAASESPPNTTPEADGDVAGPDTRLTLCCIGPLTNLAVALVTEPALAERIRVVLMGGVIGSRRVETNIGADPEAAQIVFASGAEIIMVGLDVTLQCVLAPEGLERLRAADHASARLLTQMVERWMKESQRRPTLHDPLAVAMSFDPGLCRTEPMAVRVETAHDSARGITVGRADPGSRTRVCTGVAGERFLDLFLDRVCAPPRSPEEGTRP